MSILYCPPQIALQGRRLIAGFCRFQRVGFSVVVLGFSVSLAAAEPAKRVFNIEAKPATQSLIDYARQAHTQLGYDVDMVDAILTNAVVGQYDPAEALELLLKNTGLKAEYGERGIFISRVSKRQVGGDIEERTLPVAETNSLRLAQALTPEAHGTMVQNQTSRRIEADIGEAGNKRPLEEIIVTGTNIRGIAPESSPTRTFTRKDIQVSGAATAQEFIKTMTANFGGGADESFTSAPFNGQAGNNDSNGSSINLRGLGSGSTLVLLNGRRLAASSDIGGFTDISMIPASAIERVEVLTDGASSIYGADAVAGVVNFVLRDDYKGVETSLRYGVGTQGGSPEEYRASVAGGTNWKSGNGLVLFEYYERDNLDASDRAFSQEFLLPNDLLPSQERHSVVGSLLQQLTPDLEFGADILFSQRDSKRLLTVLLGDNAGSTTHNNVSNDNLNLGANLTWNLVADWYVDFSGNYSTMDTDSNNSRSDGSSFLRNNEADYWAIEAKTSGTVFDLPGGPAKLAVGGHYRQESFVNIEENADTVRDGDREVYAFFGEVFVPVVGPGNDLPGVQRLEISASGRLEDYSDFGSQATPKLGLLWAPTDQLSLRGSFSRSFKPPTVGQTGALDRRATAAPTSFIFSVFGAAPADISIADVVLLNVTGTATNLAAETSRTVTAGFDYGIDNGPHSVSLSSTYFDIVFKGRLGDTPIPEGQSSLLAFNIAFDSPELFPDGTVLFFPSSDEVNAVLSSLVEPAREFMGADPLDTAILSFTNITRNLSITELRGVDFHGGYSFDGKFGALSLGIDGTYLIDFVQQAAVTTPTVQLLDTQFNPLNFNLRGHVGYAKDGINANVFLNYADDYRVDSTDAAAPIDSWTTVDLFLSFDTEERYVGPLLDSTTFRLYVMNLFDENPPEAPALLESRLLSFDPTNASPLGRFIAFEITKRF